MQYRNKRRVAAVAAAVSAVLAGGNASAAQLDEIVVTSRKVEERLQDVPIAISAFSSETLEEVGARDIYDLTRLTPGFAFERINRYGVQGGVSRPVIRGMSNILGEGNASVFVDGILYSDSILSFPFDIVERVEVIKGPQAAVFGRATFSGAINLVTKRGTNEHEGKVSLRAADFGDYELNALSRGPLVEDRLYYMVHGRYYSFDGMYKNSLDGRRIGGEESYNFNGSLEYRGDGVFSATLGAGFSKDDDDHAAVVLQDRFSNNCFLNVARQYYCGEVKEQKNAALDIVGLEGKEGVNRESLRLSAQLIWDFDRFRVISNSGLFQTETEYGYDSSYQGATAIAQTTVPNAPGYVRTATDPVRTGTVMRNEVTDRTEWSTELRVENDRAARVRLTGGLYYYQSRRDLEQRHFRPNPATGIVAPTIFNGETRVDNWAVFGSIAADLTERLEATVELRYAEDEIGNFKTIPTPVLIEQKFDSVSPRFTMTYKLNDSSMIYANIASGNKPGVINADPRFPPEIRFADEEESWNYEIGTKNTLLDGRLVTNLSLYYIDWEKQQLTTAYTFPTGGTMSYITNAGETEIKGLELELTALLTDNFTAGLNYAYTDAEFVELNDGEALQLFGDPSLKGYTLPGVPEHQGNIYGKFTFQPVAGYDAFVRADLAYTSKKFDQVFNLAHTGDATVVNLTAGFSTDQWDFTLFVRNLTDDRTPSSVTRYVDQLNLNVPQIVGNQPPELNNVPGTTALERAFFYPLAAKRQFGMTLAYRF
jgi:iron complex outermembrane recepter protein